MDRLKPEKRSWLMGKVNGKNTTPEMLVRRLVFAMGYRYRLHVKKLPGTPDLVFTGRKKVIFVNGCFWHGHNDCRLGRLPKTNLDFWSEKIERNRARDAHVLVKLADLGWSALTLWQCQLKKTDEIAHAVQEFLEE